MRKSFPLAYKHLILLMFCLFIGPSQGISAVAPSPPLDFPIPPRQNAPWSLPEAAFESWSPPEAVADLKKEAKAVVDDLFKLGMADPRGCAYHHVTVMEGGKRSDARGWVLPAVHGDPSRYVIGWNGLIYPVETIGKEADFTADVEILKEKGAFEEPPFDNYAEETLDKLLSEFAARPRMMRAWAAPILLMRLGIPVPLTDHLIDPFADTPPTVHGGFTYDSSLFFGADCYWLVQWARLLRGDGLAAMIEKNDRLAATRLQAFDRAWAEVERRMTNDVRAERYSFKLNPSWRSLLADARRRLSPSKVVAVSEISREIATWDELDNWDPESPPATFEKVVAAGPAAIAPLLDCLEHDQRWTRASRKEEKSNNGIREYFEFTRVSGLAISALTRILRFEVVEPLYDNVPAGDSWYADATRRMKLFSREYGNACGGELWFRILADENADIKDQLKAAKSIVRPVIAGDDHLENRLSLIYDPDARERLTDPIRSIEGDQLRTRRNPSVLDLLKRSWKKSRTETDKAIAGGAAPTRMPVTCGDTFSTAFDQSHELVLLMEEWQHGNKEVLKEHYDWLSAALTGLRKIPTQSDFLISHLCEETLILRFWAEDKGAMQDYEKFFRSSFDTNSLPIDVMKVVPEEPGMDQLAQVAFLGDNAPLSLVNQPWKRDDYPRKDIIRSDFRDGSPSPFVVLPSFRRALIEALQTKTRQGTLVVTKFGSWVKYDADKEESDPNAQKEVVLPGTGQVVRLCDVIADLITPEKGPLVWMSPSFRLEDPLPERDRAIADWIKVLSKNARVDPDP